MIRESNSVLSSLAVHKVANADTDSGLLLSNAVLDLVDADLNLLKDAFLKTLPSPECFAFTFAGNDISMNPVCKYAAEVFQDPDTLLDQSRNLARWLAECSEHPNIKGGDFFVAYFEKLQWKNQVTDALGLFKAESKETTLKIVQTADGLSLELQSGIHPDKIDKGCLIINDNAEKGFRVLINDRGRDVKYWRDDFLKISPLADEYYTTQHVLTVAKNFVTQHLPEEFELTKADQIDLLNKSVAYFKTSDRFKEDEFAESVFEDKQVVEQFKKFTRESFEDQPDLQFEDFDIHAAAVKKQAKVFKSVLKLDKNFHIYIHGNRELIEKGVDDKGRKYYKIYYTEEQ